MMWLWLLSRTLGIAAWFAASGLIIAGVAMHMQHTSQKFSPTRLRTIHTTLAVSTCLLAAAHIGTLIADTHSNIQLDDTTPWTTQPLLLPGIAAFWVLLATILYAPFRKTLPPTIWKWTHRTAYAVWPLATIHGILSGSDITTPLSIFTLSTITIIILSFVLIRGFRTPHHTPTIPAKIVRIDTEDPNIVSLYLRTPRTFTPPPGGAINLWIPTPTKKVLRTFSISRIHHDTLRISITRRENSTTLTWLKHTKIGEWVTIAPVPTTLPTHPPDAILIICGGTGITPFLSWLPTLHPTQHGTILHIGKNVTHSPLSHDLDEATHHTHLTTQRWDTATRPRPTTHDLEHLIATTNPDHIFTCGPEELTTLTAQLAQHSNTPCWKETWAPPTQHTTPLATIHAYIKGEKRTAHTIPGGTWLTTLLAAGHTDTPHECMSGQCGQCVCSIRNSEGNTPERTALACQTTPSKGDIAVFPTT